MFEKPRVIQSRLAPARSRQARLPGLLKGENQRAAIYSIRMASVNSKCLC